MYWLEICTQTYMQIKFDKVKEELSEIMKILAVIQRKLSSKTF
jgi:hypothetical protein